MSTVVLALYARRKWLRRSEIGDQWSCHRRLLLKMSVDSLDGVVLSRQDLFRRNVLVIVWSRPSLTLVRQSQECRQPTFFLQSGRIQSGASEQLAEFVSSSILVAECRSSSFFTLEIAFVSDAACGIIFLNRTVFGNKLGVSMYMLFWQRSKGEVV